MREGVFHFGSWDRLSPLSGKARVVLACAGSEAGRLGIGACPFYVKNWPKSAICSGNLARDATKRCKKAPHSRKASGNSEAD